MLKHEDNPQMPPQSAAQVRVTPEELAAAVTALQIRKEGQPGTIAIGDAVDELGLDVTPEEVLAEVQASRAAHGRKRFSLRSLLLRQRLGLYFAIGTLVIGFEYIWARLDAPNGPDTNTSSAVSVSYVASPSAAPAPVHITADSDLNVADASGEIRLLWEVGDNQPVRCTLDNQNSNFSQYSPAFPASWTLIKHQGKIYVRGWMLHVSPRVMQAHGIDVAYLNNSGFTVPVTLSLDGFTVTPDTGSYAEFHANDIHLDKHAYEKW